MTGKRDVRPATVIARASTPAAIAVFLNAGIVLAGPTPSPNQLYGIVTSNKVLTYAPPGPIYDVLGDVVVNPGVTLTIEPGVELRFAANHDTLQGGSYPGLAELAVHGVLIADASAGDSIVFAGTLPGTGQWGEVRIEAGGAAVLRGAAIRGGVNGVRAIGSATIERSSISAAGTGTGVFASGSSVVEFCRVADAGTGVIAEGAAAIRNAVISNVTDGLTHYGVGTVAACTIEGRNTGTGTGMYLWGTSTVPADTLAPVPSIVSGFHTGVLLRGGRLDNCIVRDNVDGVRIDYYGGGGLINYCTIVRNAGVGVGGHTVVLQVLNSLITNNGGYGIWCPFGYGGSYVNHTDLWMNVGGNYTGGNFTYGPSVLGFNPFYVDPGANDFRLAPHSVFYMYGTTGGQLGAYGPGGGLPTGTERGRESWGSLKRRYR